MGFLLVLIVAIGCHWQVCDDVQLFRLLQEIVYDARVRYLVIVYLPFCGLTLANGAMTSAAMFLYRSALFVSLLLNVAEL